MTFARPTLAALRDRNVADLGSAAKLRNSTERKIAAAVSGTAHGLHGHLDWASRQATPLYCDDDQLAAWSASFGVARKQPTKSTGAVSFQGTNGTELESGTTMQLADGTRVVATEAGTVSGGSVVVSVESEDYGAAGNADAGSSVRLTSPISGIETVGTVTTALAGGLDIETIADFRARLLARIRSPRIGGGTTDYEEWARATPTVDVAGVWVRKGLGTVSVYFTVDDANPIPTSPQVDDVLAYVDPLRPCDLRSFSVAAPIAQPVTYTIGVPTGTTAAVKAAIKTSLAALHLAEAEPGSSLQLSHIREAISLATGETDHQLTTPTADVTPAGSTYLLTYDESLVTFSEY